MRSEIESGYGSEAVGGGCSCMRSACVRAVVRFERERGVMVEWEGVLVVGLVVPVLGVRSEVAEGPKLAAAAEVVAVALTPVAQLVLLRLSSPQLQVSAALVLPR